MEIVDIFGGRNWGQEVSPDLAKCVHFEKELGCKLQEDDLYWQAVAQ